VEASREPVERGSFFTGPGLLSAASSNDPTTVATLAVVGAATGYALCWLVVLAAAMLAVVQALAAAVGAACKTSLQGAIRRRFGRRWALVTLIAIVSVNLITLVADIKAGAEAISLLTGLRGELFVVPFACLVGFLLVSHSFARIERVLQLLPLAFVSYAASAFLARFDVGALLRGLLVPHLDLSFEQAAMAVAILGTMLTSYVYVWESLEIARRRPAQAAAAYYKWDAAFGMLAVGAVFLFVVVASAATLGVHHLHIDTAGDLARALTPLAGPWAGSLFGIGLLGSAILVVPILAGTNGYVAAQTFGWKGDLDAPLRDARAFYAVVIASLALGAVAALAPLSPVALLYWASVAGGIATPLTLVLLVRLAVDRTAMGAARVRRPLAIAGWVICGVVGTAAAAFLFSLLG
jgi:Mn2+/Fe2+ NRAMP family transporter